MTDWTSRRRVLAQISVGRGAIAGLAGCGGKDGGTGGDSGDTSYGGDDGGRSHDSGGSGAIACTDLTSGYAAYDFGEIAFGFDMELPEPGPTSGTLVHQSIGDTDMAMIGDMKAELDDAEGIAELAEGILSMADDGDSGPTTHVKYETEGRCFDADELQRRLDAVTTVAEAVDQTSAAGK